MTVEQVQSLDTRKQIRKYHICQVRTKVNFCSQQNQFYQVGSPQPLSIQVLALFSYFLCLLAHRPLLIFKVLFTPQQVSLVLLIASLYSNCWLKYFALLTSVHLHHLHLSFFRFFYPDSRYSSTEFGLHQIPSLAAPIRCQAGIVLRPAG